MPKDPQLSADENILASDFDWFGTSVGGTAYAVSMDGVGTTYNEGRIVAFRAGSASIGTATLNINSIGAKNIKIWGPSGLGPTGTSEISAGQIVLVTYDSTNDCFIMVSPKAEVDRTQSASVSVTNTGTSFTTDDTGVITAYLPRAARIRLSFAGQETGRASNAQTQNFTVAFNIDAATTVITGYTTANQTQSNTDMNASCTVVTSLLTAGLHTFRMRIVGSSSSSMTRGITGTLYVTPIV